MPTSLEYLEDLIARSHVRDVFVPRRPVAVKSLLFGRDNEVTRLVRQLSSPGGHAVLFGDRGVGKTSLANVVAAHFRKKLGDANVFVYRCSQRDEFLHILKTPLRANGIDLSLKETSNAHEEGSSANIKAGFAGADVTSKRGITEKRVPDHVAAKPSYIVETIGSKSGLLIVDELDVVQNIEVIHELSTLIKQLSDANSLFKIMLVGIARTVQDLFQGHKSAARVVAEVKLRRLHERELRQIIIEGASRVGLSFANEVILDISILSAGYPYFTHLIALKCAENAIVEQRRHISMAHLSNALTIAAEDAESSLRDAYQNAIQYNRKSLEARLLDAAEKCRKTEFLWSAWRENILHDGLPIPQREELNTSILHLIQMDGDGILERIKPEVFRFIDRRMVSYIRLVKRSEQVANGKLSGG